MAAHLVEVADAAGCLVELITLVSEGVEVILTRNGEAVARIIPAAAPIASRRFGSARGLIEMAEDFDAPLDDLRDYME